MAFRIRTPGLRSLKRASAKMRIAFGLTCLLVSVLLSAMSLGLLPDERAAVMQGRAKLCEALAINSSLLVSRDDVRRLNAILKSVVRRNNDMLSAGLRHREGDVLVEAGDHSERWSEEGSESSQVYVPIYADEERWGTLEVRFESLEGGGFLGAILGSDFELVLFVALTCFVLFLFYLGRMLKHLDPSKVVPSRVRSALDTLAEGLLLMDKDERIVLANNVFSEIVGESPEHLQGLQASRLEWKKPDGEDSLFPWSRAFQEEALQSGAVLGLESKNQGPRTFKVNASPIFGDKNEVRGVLASFDDITDLEEKKVELKKSKDAAEGANRAKSDFLARMSHEIRTPMNSILGFSDVLRRGIENGEKERHEFLNRIHSSGKHLLELINDILDLSKVESGKLEIVRERCEPHSIIREVISVLRVRADEKGVELGFKVSGKLPETVLTDSKCIRQILTNLAGNAIKFTNSGGVTIRAELEIGAPNPRMRIEVADTGVGMKPEALEKIFDPFVQADSTVTREFGGTGLGLAISLRLVEALGGEIQAESRLGEGSVFTFTFDTGSLEGIEMIDASVAEEAPIEDATEIRTIRLPESKVLVVEDGESNRELLSLVLSRAGATVETAENGQLGLDAAVGDNYDLILLDMQMPIMDGYTAARKMRDAGLEIPIIALTAQAMQGDEERCREAGCSGFVAKPISIDYLLSQVAEGLGGAIYVDEDVVPSKAEEKAEEKPVKEAVRSTLPMTRPGFRKVVEVFLDRLETQLEEMDAALESRDVEKLGQLAHWLKGSGGTAGFEIFTNLARQLEEVMAEGDFEKVETLLAKVREVASRVSMA